MKQTLLAAAVALLCLNEARAQQLEVGFSGGISQYYGDLAHQWIHQKTIHPAISLVTTYHISENYAIGLSVGHTTISGNDALSEDDFLQVRNLSFRSPVTEVRGLITWYPLPFRPGSRAWFPYVQSGLSLFRFNPQANYKGEWIALQPLGTEGQGTSTFPGRQPYSLTQIGIPVALGCKVAINEYLFIGLETSLLWAMTDYLDDVSLTYVNPDVLIEENGLLAYQLSNRTGEFLQAEPLNLGNGSMRGNTESLDQVGYFEVTFSVLIPGVSKSWFDPHRKQLNCSF